MPRIAAQEASRIHELEAELAVVREGDPPALERLAPALADLLEVPVTMAYGAPAGPALAPERVGFAHANGVSRARLDEALRPLTARWRGARGEHGLAEVARAERNRAVVLPGSIEGGPTLASELGSFFGEGSDRALEQAIAGVERLATNFCFAELSKVRALVCEQGGRRLAWLGGLTPERPTAKQAAMLTAVVPAVRRRLLLEESLHTSAISAAALPVLLEALPTPAFLLDPRGAIVAANSAGRALAEREGSSTRAALALALEGEGARFGVTRFAAAGLGPHHLVVEHAPVADPALKVAAAERRYQLSKREVTVLRQLCRGRSNKAMAADLGTAERTVEDHVGRLMRKLGCESRSAAVAQVLLG